MDICDSADIQQQHYIDSVISNRVRFKKWDGNPRYCDCGEPIQKGRLEAVNAYTCIHCASS